MKVIQDDCPVRALREFHDVGICDSTASICLGNSPFIFTEADRALRVMLRDVQDHRNTWGNSNTFVLTEEEIEALFQVGPIFLRIVTCWENHQVVEAKKLLRSKRYIL